MIQQISNLWGEEKNHQQSPYPHMEKKMKRNQWIPFILSLLVFSLSACSSAPETSSQTNESNPGTAAEEPFTLAQLVATDPGTVQLAAGQVQLIEFFAYW